jgi:hypothetical protein
MGTLKNRFVNRLKSLKSLIYAATRKAKKVVSIDDDCGRADQLDKAIRLLKNYTKVSTSASMTHRDFQKPKKPILTKEQRDELFTTLKKKHIEELKAKKLKTKKKSTKIALKDRFRQKFGRKPSIFF